MKPSRGTNTKARTDLSCPSCGMNLSDSPQGGFVKGNQTYCCEGCAEETGCTCRLPVTGTPRSFNRWGNRGQRNAENSVGDKNVGDRSTSGKAIEKTSTGLPKRTASMIGTAVVNPRRTRPLPARTDLTRREATRRRKLMAQSTQPARRKKTGRGSAVEKKTHE